ncbi:VWA domain-containing protein [Nanchangia anserum]|uniref:VWA domain-containing protein n=1 Tax=Nanchangia anserum TaxID=2692125 RepID=A0A8I0KRL5_9ACTO|nr:VWA domain-containing protein [Nanchangia anserum]MBD3689527.1 VWA domain-containing protein [Nanchangia anserum]QOX81717.1 VWA domain-containing protein [Nanchangia anserum]
MSAVLALLALAIFVAAAVIGWHRGGVHAGEPTRVAHSGYVAALPIVQRIRARRKRRVIFAGMGMAIIAAILVALATVPSHHEAQRPKVTTRDVIFCLDVSGSMLPLDRDIIESMSRLTRQFNGERVGLVLWNSRPLTVFPPTDDYALVHRQLAHLSDLLDTVHVEDHEVYGSGELIDYLETTTSDDEYSSSLVGDGLATCAQAFPPSRDERSRSLVFATDNLQIGNGIYTLPQAIDQVRDASITLFTVYSSLDDNLGANLKVSQARDQLESETRRAGGRFFAADDPDVTDEILAQIEASLAGEVDDPPPPIVHDDDRGLTQWLALLFVPTLAWGWAVRR